MKVDIIIDVVIVVGIKSIIFVDYSKQRKEYAKM